MPNITKNAQGYGYKYTDLAAINDFIEEQGETYYQEIEVIDGTDYIVTVRQKEGTEIFRMRGARIVQASLSGKNNPAQEQGSGLTYARRYSLLMAYGLATEDDDGESLTLKKKRPATDTSKSGADQEEDAMLKRAKVAINEQLEAMDLTLPLQKKAFITNVLNKSTIDTLDDADAVGDAIDNARPVE